MNCDLAEGKRAETLRELAKILFCETALGYRKPSTEWVMAVTGAFPWVWALMGLEEKLVAESLFAPADERVGFCSLQEL